ncbi:MAG: M23 family metallopeptidase [Oligoflexales bacterium]|nr:M23 family metallopeptidase [Oligoflexales bacterium]
MNSTRQFAIPIVLVKFIFVVALFFLAYLGYLISDYIHLRKLKETYNTLALENEGLKGEAKLLASNLENVKRSLRRVQTYGEKLAEITQLQVSDVSKKTGIGPLSVAEYNIAQKNSSNKDSKNYFPLGIDIDKLVFKTVFDNLDNVGQEANENALELQRLLSKLSQEKSMLLSIPSIAPVNGWLASGYGSRISPFTGKKIWHMGIDIASPIGTPVYSPAGGVVIFSGAKSGFGKFIMIAHGYGIVTRYGHNAENLVQAGQKVKRGDQIGAVGSTGRTTGPHCHYEVLVNGINVNPKKFILNDFHY